MRSLKRLGQVILYVSNMGRSVEFYQDKLGLPVSYPGPEANLAEQFWVTLSTGGFEIALHAGRESGPPAEAPALVFLVEDLEAAVRDVTDHGVTLTEITEPHPGVKLCNGRDPDGHVFFLKQAH